MRSWSPTCFHRVLRPSIFEQLTYILLLFGIPSHRKRLVHSASAPSGFLVGWAPNKHPSKGRSSKGSLGYQQHAYSSFPRHPQVSVLNVQPVMTRDVQHCSLSPYATRAVNLEFSCR